MLDRLVPAHFLQPGDDPGRVPLLVIPDVSPAAILGVEEAEERGHRPGRLPVDGQANVSERVTHDHLAAEETAHVLPTVMDQHPGDRAELRLVLVPIREQPAAATDDRLVDFGGCQRPSDRLCRGRLSVEAADVERGLEAHGFQSSHEGSHAEIQRPAERGRWIASLGWYDSPVPWTWPVSYEPMQIPESSSDQSRGDPI